MQDYFEVILRTYHKQQGTGKGVQKDLAQITHRSQGSISNYLKDPSSIRAGDLQAICRAWSINLEDTGRLIRCCEE